MLFSSQVFLYFFLPITLIVYYLSPKKFRNFILLIASLIFYAWGEPVYILIMLFSTIFNYVTGLLIEKFQKKNQHKYAKIVLIVSVVGNLGIIGFFKYSDFLISNINSLFNLNISLLAIALPIGISFYTFQTMSYTIDIYKQNVKAQKNFISFATYVTLFPQLIAGPIVKYRDVSESLENRKENITDFSEGIKRFIIGLFKKVMIANNVGFIWESIHSLPYSEISLSLAWVGAICYSLQIYYDFSGYSDMAIGLGKMFGFHFLENFNYPYIAKSITNFWRRWHISLSSWFKEYVYIPLGGSRKTIARTVINLLIVWFLTGLWHGASWNFVVWGLYFGVLLIIEKFVLKKVLDKMPSFIRHLYTLFFVIISWVIFACPTLEDGLNYISIMFNFNNEIISTESIYLISTHFVLFIIAIIGCTPIFKKIKEKLKNNKIFMIIEIIICLILFFISLSFLVGSTYNPFLYFRF